MSSNMDSICYIDPSKNANRITAMPMERYDSMTTEESCNSMAGTHVSPHPSMWARTAPRS